MDFPEQIFKKLVQAIYRDRKEWSLDELEEVTKMIAIHLEPKKVSNRRGRPKKKPSPTESPGLWMVKGPKQKPGRKGEPNRKELAIGIYYAVLQEKVTLHKNGEKVTDKRALEEILKRIASNHHPNVRAGRYVSEKYNRVRKLLTEGKKLVSK